MQFIVTILIAAALALGIYGAVVERGANIVSLTSRVPTVAVISGAMQLLAAVAGFAIGKWILSGEVSRERSGFWSHVLAGVLLAIVGIRMLMLALRKKTLLEHRMEHIDMKNDIILVLRLCVHSLLAGTACGIMEFSLLTLLIAVFAATALSALGGYAGGRAYGGGMSHKAYALGGGILCALSVFLQFVRG